MISRNPAQPAFLKATLVATPPSLVAVGLKILQRRSTWFDLQPDDIILDNSAYTGFMFVLGFLLVFRTSQGYTRFWEGAHAMFQMRQKLCDAVSSLVAFVQHSKAGTEEVAAFQHLLVRVISLLHAMACAQIAEVSDLKFEVIDIHGLDQESIVYLERIPRDVRTEVVMQWLQRLVVEHIETGLLPVPAPILTRVFSELSSAMSAFATASKISSVSFPPACAKLQLLLLIMHSFLTPVVVALWTGHVISAFVFVFAPVFCLWCMHFVASEIEQPFGVDANDLGVHESQQRLNEFLVLLLSPRTNRAPKLMENAVRDITLLVESNGPMTNVQSFDASANHLVQKVSNHSLQIKAVSSVGGCLDVKDASSLVHPLRSMNCISANERSKKILAQIQHALGQADHLASQRERAEKRSEGTPSIRHRPTESTRTSTGFASEVELRLPPEDTQAGTPPSLLTERFCEDGTFEKVPVTRGDASLGQGVLSSPQKQLRDECVSPRWSTLMGGTIAGIGDARFTTYSNSSYV